MSTFALSISIWCYCIGTEGKIIGQAFKIRPNQSNDISDVKELISKHLPDIRLPLSLVRIRRATGLTIFDSLIEQDIQRAYESNQLQTLRPQDKLRDLGLQDDDLFIVDLAPESALPQRKCYFLTPSPC